MFQDKNLQSEELEIQKKTETLQSSQDNGVDLWNVYVDDDGNRHPHCPACTEAVELDRTECLNCGYPDSDCDAMEDEKECELESEPSILVRLTKMKREGNCFVLHPDVVNGDISESQPLVSFRTETDDDWDTWNFFLGYILSDEIIYNRFLELAEREDRNLRLHGCIKGKECRCPQHRGDLEA